MLFRKLFDFSDKKVDQLSVIPVFLEMVYVREVTGETSGQKVENFPSLKFAG